MFKIKQEQIQVTGFSNKEIKLLFEAVLEPELAQLYSIELTVGRQTEEKGGKHETN